MKRNILRLTAIAASAILALNLSAHRLLDLSSDAPLPLASITDRSGNVVGMTDKNGEIPRLSSGLFPVTFSYVGFEPMEITAEPEADVRMVRQDYELPEIEVVAGSRPLLHLKGYMREVTSVLGSSDSVTLFRESIVDYLVPVEKSKVKGWRKARILASKTYVRMTDSSALDSVSTEHEYEFMLWGNRYGMMPPTKETPHAVMGKTFACDTIMGKYYPKIVWWKSGDVTRWYGDGLADEKDHVSSPTALKLLGLTADFTDVSTNHVFSTPDGNKVGPVDLKQVSMSVNMLARGKLFKMSFGSSSPVDVRSYVEFYPTDREFLTDEEGRRLKKELPDVGVSEVEAPENAAPLHPAVRRIVERVRSNL